jgi:hypothetical protein
MDAVIEDYFLHLITMSLNLVILTDDVGRMVGLILTFILI